MARYGKFNNLDDPYSEAGDTGFVRMNTRVRSSQLQPGEVVLSRNGRMDTDLGWQPRKGVRAVSNNLVTTEVIPTVLAAEVTSSNFFTVKNVPYLFDDVANGETVEVSAASWDATDTDDPASAEAPGVVTITFSASLDLTVDSGDFLDILGYRFVANIAGLGSDAGVDVTGNRDCIISNSPTNTMVRYHVPGMTNPPGPGPYPFSLDTTETFTSFTLDSATTAIYATGKYSDPNDDNKEWLLIASNSRIYAYDLTSDNIPGSEVELTYPSGETLTGDGDVVQAFDKIYLFRDGDKALIFDPDGGASPIGSGGTMTVASTSATQHQIFQTSGNTTIAANGVATITEADGAFDTAGYSVGDRVWFTVVEATGIDFPKGQFFRAKITAADPGGPSTATYYIAGATATDETVVYSTEPSLGGGFISTPGAGWGVYHQRRFWLPYFYTDADPPVDRGVRDEIIASDILSPGNYDPLSNQFRITAGTADYLVALQPFADDYLIAFNRNSIHLLSGVSGTLVDVVTTQLTTEVGCVARKTVVEYGGSIFFLSDNGFYSVEFMDERNLRGADMPLSESIKATTDRINKDSAHLSTAVYHDNRIWLTVPLDGAAKPNTILVYNLLNKGWESEDVIGETPEERWAILDLIPASINDLNSIFAVNDIGGIHELDSLDGSRDSIYRGQASEATLEKIDAQLLTRVYDHGTIERKKYHTWDLHLVTGNTSGDGVLTVETEDPDSTTEVGTVLDILGNVIPPQENASIRFRGGNQRGYGASLRFKAIDGRPRIRAIRSQASKTYRATESAQ